ncbi:SusC/RagA family TonB-linked outer membrane protein [Spirosoma sp. KCTC 42546]|uniref:SusC/RagA family TonB-linked outer membrane protein n=1 Tax=Spirosoma sp. KCTC 42546 TaxID=2520506 RepID=UPI00115BD946|nr:SusC/RagA family TonB-linked outer membrane protein [Spirosoma sp. KCTC 42546]QDK79287.1 SusC/RagA family TonB-linked outer membrane protein [Spirosoma sp. KCTC 42546]
MDCTLLRWPTHLGKLLTMLWLLSVPVLAQTISGKVTNTGDGALLPGVTIVEKGSTKGTVTDSQGKYSISLSSSQATLIFSYIGFVAQEVTVNGRSVVDVSLKEDATQLGEVVVTALGITKDKKALGYSVTEVKGSEFTQARENNVANALSGKIAGVNATGLSTGPGGSSRIIIRGNGSLTGDNQPLYVINGMPIDNTVPGGSATTNGGQGNVDRGDGIAGINPDDIESISVLKGGTAAALYGSRAANGVILITTKKGKAQRGIGVEYNSTFTMENAAVFPDWQYEYGQGDGAAKPTTQAQGIAWGRRSWGAKIDGSDFVAADGQTHPYSAQKNNIKNFYQTGKTFTNTLAFTGGNEKVNYRFSLSDLDAKGILPTNTYNRKTGNLNINGSFGDKIALEAVAQYTLEKGHNKTGAGDALGNPNWTPYMIGNTSDIRWLNPGYDASGNEIAWNDADIASNSYFVVNKYQQDDSKNRFIGQLGLTYKILKNLSVKGTVSRDFYNYNYRYILPTGTRYIPNGQFNQLKTDVSETNSMLTANYNTTFGHFGVSALAGMNQRNFSYNQLNLTGATFTIPFFYSSTNLATSSTIPLNQHTRTNSVFGSVDLDYKGIAFLTATGRQDWFSTLSPQNNTIFYPSVGGSFVLSQAFQLPRMVDYAKVRASWAQVGGATPDPYVINLTYSMIPSSGQPLQNVTTNATAASGLTNAGLKPLTSTTFEAGIDLQFFNKKVGLDLTYYNRATTNDIVQTSTSPTSGYNSVYLNVGKLNNRGIEALVTVMPVRTSNFGWNLSYNVAYNQSKVVKLADGINSMQMATSVGNWAYINSIEGSSYGTIVGTTRVRDAKGNIVYDPTSGFAQKSALQELGKGVPPLTMGLTNEFRYKNFSLNILLDGKFGNKVFSVMEVYANRMGKLKRTLDGRENGLTLTGVTPTGDTYTRTVAKENLRVYYDNDKNYTDLFLHDGSFVKLRQVIFSYNIPTSALKFVKLQSASISFVARNLLTLYKQTDNFDPEQSFTNSSNQGFESLGLPRTRSYGANLIVKF